jgi:hypothetical protein
VLFSLDAAEYPHASRKVASWLPLGMGRLARHLTLVRALRLARCCWSMRSVRSGTARDTFQASSARLRYGPVEGKAAR